MLCEKILGTLTDPQFAGKPVDYLQIPWHDTYNKLHRSMSNGGRDVAVRLDDTILHKGLKPGDVLGIDTDGTVIAVDVPATEVLVVTLSAPSPFSYAKIGYEIGNNHAPLFAGNNDAEFITTYNRPMEVLLQKLHGVTVTKRIQKLDFSKQISTIVGHSHHENAHKDDD